MLIRLISVGKKLNVCIQLRRRNGFINKKGKELKSFEENINNIMLIDDSRAIVELESKIQILNFK